MGSAVYTTIGYLARDKRWSMEKPYTARFDVSQIRGALQTNHSFETRNVAIHDARDHGLFDLDQNGFTFAKCSSVLSSTQLEDAENIKNIYFPEVARALRDLKPYYSEFMLVDYEIRKRAPSFPLQIGARTAYQQPLTLPHLDFSKDGGPIFVRSELSRTSSELQGKPYDIINVWRVLEGPNNDWPLALLDYETIDFENDPILNDIVYENSCGENELIRANDKHRWYYLPDQGADDLIIFRQCSTVRFDVPRGWHVSFENPLDPLKGAKSRESIEIRLMAFRNM